MKISIITPSYNQACFIEDTIQSVLHQDADDVEHIVIDGGSDDGTVDILRRYTHLRWVSESDHGQSDAINKGFHLATGDIIAWINSDDYYEENIFAAVEQYFKRHAECSVLYGDITYVGKDKTLRYEVKGPSLSFQSLSGNPDLVRQPSIFWRKSALDKVGGVDSGLHVVMDYDFFLRLARTYEFHYMSRNLSYFRDYGENKTHAMMKRQAYELFLVAVRHRFLNFRMLKFIVGRYLDGCGERNIAKALLAPLREPRV
jgi:glycosyltransferase involved in cell wall biosynthesis